MKDFDDNVALLQDMLDGLEELETTAKVLNANLDESQAAISRSIMDGGHAEVFFGPTDLLTRIHVLRSVVDNALQDYLDHGLSWSRRI